MVGHFYLRKDQEALVANLMTVATCEGFMVLKIPFGAMNL